MCWKLKVLEYGKIEKAEIEAAPLTLFVGDNNSGKSYLMSLLWGIQNFGVAALLEGHEGQESREELVIMDWVRRQVAIAWEKGGNTVRTSDIAYELQTVLDKGLKRNKDNLVKKIFNSQSVKIKELQIELNDGSFKITRDKRDSSLRFVNKESFGLRLDFSDKQLIELNDTFQWFMICIVFSMILGIHINDISGIGYNIYLPSSRTGFMLTKDIINKVGRNTVFNIGLEQRNVSPFSRPVNQFLDVMNDLTMEAAGNERFCDVIKYLEGGMAEGTVHMSTLPNREVSYIPAGQTEGIPLRIVSAVVTELSPLILILKHREYLDTLFYEEPEMCLHPQLQQKMAKVICWLVNRQMKMVVTTHSDIILQHINNMISLSDRADKERICQQFGYSPDDLLKGEQIKVYQLKSKPDGKTWVENLTCGKNGFEIPTFNDALDKIMDEAYRIQG